MNNIALLVEEKLQIEKRLEVLHFGSIEIRKTKSKQYIYVHRREKGIPVTKYVGEYSNDLYNLILENNVIARDLKKRLRKIEKQLGEANYMLLFTSQPSLNNHKKIINLYQMPQCSQMRHFLIKN